MRGFSIHFTSEGGEVDVTDFLCSVIGGVVIVLGFYAVLWGKAQEEKHEEKPSAQEPLLQEKHLEI